MPISGSTSSTKPVRQRRVAGPREAWFRWRRRLRGRQGWIAGATLVGLIAGALAGYHTGQPVWRAMACVEVEPLVPFEPGGAENENASWQMPLFEALVERHTQTLVHLAHHESAQAHRSQASATRIEVSALSTDPQQARDAVARVITAYQQMPIFSLQDAPTQHISDMLDQRGTLERQLVRAQKQAAQMDRASAGQSVAQVYAQQVVRLNQLAAQVQQTRAALASFGASPPTLLVAPSRQVLEQRQQALALQSAFAREARDLPSSLRSQLLLEQQLLDWQRGASQAHEPMASIQLDGLAGRSTLTLTGEQLRRLLKTLEQQQTQARLTLATLSQKQRQVAEVLREIEGIQRQIALANLRLRYLAGHAPMPGRAKVMQASEVEPGMAYDPRPDRAWAGAAVGGLLWCGLALGLASGDRKLRRPDRAMLDEPASALLGTVPQISAQHTDAALTALSIHEVRALLQLCAKRDGARAFAITSPQRGAGRTSVTVGLASSLALSGTPTLVVDCDLSGRQRDGSNGQRTLDTALLELHYLNEDDTDPLLSGRRETGALAALMDGAELTDCIMPTRLAWLSVLPATGLRPDDIGRLSGPMLRRLIDEASPAFGAILFDTGPVLGSVEAMIVAGAVDAVVMVVPHGQRQSRLDEAMGRLRMAGAKVVGAVFNRASAAQLRVASPVHGGPVDRPGLSHSGSGIFAAAIEAQSGVGPASGRAPSPLETRPPHTDQERDDAAGGDDLLNLGAGSLPETPPGAQITPPTAAPETMSQTLDQLIDETIVQAQRPPASPSKRASTPPSPQRAKVVAPALDAFLKPTGDMPTPSAPDKPL